MYHDKASVGFEIAWQFFDDVIDYHSPVFAGVPCGFDDVLWLPVWWSWNVGRVCDDKIEALVFYRLVQVALLNVDVFLSIDSRVVLRIGNGSRLCLWLRRCRSLQATWWMFRQTRVTLGVFVSQRQCLVVNSSMIGLNSSGCN